ncbi:hypothetical protein EJ419_05535 [Alloscardovia theropitheci]|uniref:Uncharacterized protein n=2 Tax=Alloscardovia theropitheci TaxID=2496842 RepID=A0A4R0QPG8_9BIFI|nr:hypothetical protein EJ419_05535 [Alloscardovia theropitheci]
MGSSVSSGLNTTSGITSATGEGKSSQGKNTSSDSAAAGKDSASDATHLIGDSGLATGAGSFLSGLSGVLHASADTGIAPSGVSHAMESGAKAADIIANVTNNTTGSDSSEYTSGSADAPTTVINQNTTSSTPSDVTITTTPPAVDTSRFAPPASGDQHVDVDVHVTGNTDNN